MTNTEDRLVEEGGDKVSRKASELGYEADAAEQADLKYLVENSCISCDKILPRYAVRILPPAYVQERDKHVRSGLVSRRLMCVECYGSMKKAHKHRLRSHPMAGQGVVAKDLVMQFLTR